MDDPWSRPEEELPLQIVLPVLVLILALTGLLVRWLSISLEDELHLEDQRHQKRRRQFLFSSESGDNPDEVFGPPPSTPGENLWQVRNGGLLPATPDGGGSYLRVMEWAAAGLAWQQLDFDSRPRLPSEEQLSKCFTWPQTEDESHVADFTNMQMEGKQRREYMGYNQTDQNNDCLLPQNYDPYGHVWEITDESLTQSELQEIRLCYLAQLGGDIGSVAANDSPAESEESLRVRDESRDNSDELDISDLDGNDSRVSGATNSCATRPGELTHIKECVRTPARASAEIYIKIVSANPQLNVPSIRLETGEEEEGYIISASPANDLSTTIDLNLDVNCRREKLSENSMRGDSAERDQGNLTLINKQQQGHVTTTETINNSADLEHSSGVATDEEVASSGSDCGICSNVCNFHYASREATVIKRNSGALPGRPRYQATVTNDHTFQVLSRDFPAECEYDCNEPRRSLFSLDPLTDDNDKGDIGNSDSKLISFCSDAVAAVVNGSRGFNETNHPEIRGTEGESPRGQGSVCFDIAGGNRVSLSGPKTRRTESIEKPSECPDSCPVNREPDEAIISVCRDQRNPSTNAKENTNLSHERVISKTPAIALSERIIRVSILSSDSSSVNCGGSNGFRDSYLPGIVVTQSSLDSDSRGADFHQQSTFTPYFACGYSKFRVKIEGKNTGETLAPGAQDIVSELPLLEGRITPSQVEARSSNSQKYPVTENIGAIIDDPIWERMPVTDVHLSGSRDDNNASSDIIPGVLVPETTVADLRGSKFQADGHLVTFVSLGNDLYRVLVPQECCQHANSNEIGLAPSVTPSVVLQSSDFERGLIADEESDKEHPGGKLAVIENGPRKEFSGQCESTTGSTKSHSPAEGVEWSLPITPQTNVTEPSEPNGNVSAAVSEVTSDVITAKEDIRGGGPMSILKGKSERSNVRKRVRFSLVDNVLPTETRSETDHLRGEKGHSSVVSYHHRDCFKRNHNLDKFTAPSLVCEDGAGISPNHITRGSRSNDLPDAPVRLIRQVRITEPRVEAERANIIDIFSPVINPSDRPTSYILTGESNLGPEARSRPYRHIRTRGPVTDLDLNGGIQNLQVQDSETGSAEGGTVNKNILNSGIGRTENVCESMVKPENRDQSLFRETSSGNCGVRLNNNPIDEPQIRPIESETVDYQRQRGAQPTVHPARSQPVPVPFRNQNNLGNISERIHNHNTDATGGGHCPQEPAESQVYTAYTTAVTDGYLYATDERITKEFVVSNGSVINTSDCRVRSPLHSVSSAAAVCYQGTITTGLRTVCSNGETCYYDSGGNHCREENCGICGFTRIKDAFGNVNKDQIDRLLFCCCDSDNWERNNVVLTGETREHNHRPSHICETTGLDIVENDVVVDRSTGSFDNTSTSSNGAEHVGVSRHSREVAFFAVFGKFECSELGGSSKEERQKDDFVNIDTVPEDKVNWNNNTSPTRTEDITEIIRNNGETVDMDLIKRGKKPPKILPVPVSDPNLLRYAKIGSKRVVIVRDHTVIEKEQQKAQKRAKKKPKGRLVKLAPPGEEFERMSMRSSSFRSLPPSASSNSRRSFRQPVHHPGSPTGLQDRGLVRGSRSHSSLPPNLRGRGNPDINFKTRSELYYSDQDHYSRPRGMNKPRSAQSLPDRSPYQTSSQGRDHRDGPNRPKPIYDIPNTHRKPLGPSERHLHKTGHGEYKSSTLPSRGHAQRDKTSRREYREGQPRNSSSLPIHHSSGDIRPRSSSNPTEIIQGSNSRHPRHKPPAPHSDKDRHHGRSDEENYLIPNQPSHTRNPTRGGTSGRDSSGHGGTRARSRQNVKPPDSNYTHPNRRQMHIVPTVEIRDHSTHRTREGDQRTGMARLTVPAGGSSDRGSSEENSVFTNSSQGGNRGASGSSSEEGRTNGHNVPEGPRKMETCFYWEPGAETKQEREKKKERQTIMEREAKVSPSVSSEDFDSLDRHRARERREKDLRNLAKAQGSTFQGGEHQQQMQHGAPLPAKRQTINRERPPVRHSDVDVIYAVPQTNTSTSAIPKESPSHRDEVPLDRSKHPQPKRYPDTRGATGGRENSRYEMPSSSFNRVQRLGEANTVNKLSGGKETTLGASDDSRIEDLALRPMVMSSFKIRPKETTFSTPSAPPTRIKGKETSLCDSPGKVYERSKNDHSSQKMSVPESKSTLPENYKGDGGSSYSGRHFGIEDSSHSSNKPKSIDMMFTEPEESSDDDEEFSSDKESCGYESGDERNSIKPSKFGAVRPGSHDNRAKAEFDILEQNRLNAQPKVNIPSEPKEEKKAGVKQIFDLFSATEDEHDTNVEQKPPPNQVPITTSRVIPGKEAPGRRKDPSGVHIVLGNSQGVREQRGRARPPPNGNHPAPRQQMHANPNRPDQIESQRPVAMYPKPNSSMSVENNIRQGSYRVGSPERSSVVLWPKQDVQQPPKVSPKPPTNANHDEKLMQTAKGGKVRVLPVAVGDTTNLRKSPQRPVEKKRISDVSALTNGNISPDHDTIYYDDVLHKPPLEEVPPLEEEPRTKPFSTVFCLRGVKVTKRVIPLPKHDQIADPVVPTIHALQSDSHIQSNGEHEEGLISPLSISESSAASVLEHDSGKEDDDTISRASDTPTLRLPVVDDDERKRFGSQIGEERVPPVPSPRPPLSIQPAEVESFQFGIRDIPSEIPPPPQYSDAEISPNPDSASPREYRRTRPSYQSSTYTVQDGIRNHLPPSNNQEKHGTPGVTAYREESMNSRGIPTESAGDTSLQPHQHPGNYYQTNESRRSNSSQLEPRSDSLHPEGNAENLSRHTRDQHVHPHSVNGHISPVTLDGEISRPDNHLRQEDSEDPHTGPGERSYDTLSHVVPHGEKEESTNHGVTNGDDRWYHDHNQQRVSQDDDSWSDQEDDEGDLNERYQEKPESYEIDRERDHYGYEHGDHHSGPDDIAFETDAEQNTSQLRGGNMYYTANDMTGYDDGDFYQPMGPSSDDRSDYMHFSDLQPEEPQERQSRAGTMYIPDTDEYNDDFDDYDEYDDDVEAGDTALSHCYDHIMEPVFLRLETIPEEPEGTEPWTEIASDYSSFYSEDELSSTEEGDVAVEQRSLDFVDKLPSVVPIAASEERVILSNGTFAKIENGVRRTPLYTTPSLPVRNPAATNTKPMGITTSLPVDKRHEPTSDPDYLFPAADEGRLPPRATTYDDQPKELNGRIIIEIPDDDSSENEAFIMDDESSSADEDLTGNDFEAIEDFDHEEYEDDQEEEGGGVPTPTINRSFVIAIVAQNSVVGGSPSTVGHPEQIRPKVQPLSDSGSRPPLVEEDDFDVLTDDDLPVEAVYHESPLKVVSPLKVDRPMEEDVIKTAQVVDLQPADEAIETKIPELAKVRTQYSEMPLNVIDSRTADPQRIVYPVKEAAMNILKTPKQPADHRGQPLNPPKIAVADVCIKKANVTVEQSSGLNEGRHPPPKAPKLKQPTGNEIDHDTCLAEGNGTDRTKSSKVKDRSGRRKFRKLSGDARTEIQSVIADLENNLGTGITQEDKQSEDSRQATAVVDKQTVIDNSHADRVTRPQAPIEQRAVRRETGSNTPQPVKTVLNKGQSERTSNSSNVVETQLKSENDSELANRHWSTQPKPVDGTVSNRIRTTQKDSAPVSSKPPTASSLKLEIPKSKVSALKSQQSNQSFHSPEFAPTLPNEPGDRGESTDDGVINKQLERMRENLKRLTLPEWFRQSDQYDKLMHGDVRSLPSYWSYKYKTPRRLVASTPATPTGERKLGISTQLPFLTAANFRRSNYSGKEEGRLSPTNSLPDQWTFAGLNVDTCGLSPAASPLPSPSNPGHSWRFDDTDASPINEDVPEDYDLSPTVVNPPETHQVPSSSSEDVGKHDKCPLRAIPLTESSSYQEAVHINGGIHQPQTRPSGNDVRRGTQSEPVQAVAPTSRFMNGTAVFCLTSDMFKTHNTERLSNSVPVYSNNNDDDDVITNSFSSSDHTGSRPSVSHVPTVNQLFNTDDHSEEDDDALTPATKTYYKPSSDWVGHGLGDNEHYSYHSESDHQLVAQYHSMQV